MSDVLVRISPVSPPILLLLSVHLTSAMPTFGSMVQKGKLQKVENKTCVSERPSKLISSPPSLPPSLPPFGKTYLAAWAVAPPVKALKRVDFPTLGRPTMPAFSFMVTWWPAPRGKKGGREEGRRGG